MFKREEIFNYIKNKYNELPEYLWSKYPNYAVLKHNENNKWYAIIMDVEKEKLGLVGKDKIDIIDMKCYPDMIGNLRKEQDVFPAYHMNKEYWISIALNGNFKKEKLFDLIDISYEITSGKQ